MKKRFCFITMILILLVQLVTLTAYADDSTILLESRVSEQSAVLYTRDTESAVTQARIAFENIDDITVDGQDGSLPITTWLLMDNSISIKLADQTRAKELLADIVSSRCANEAFTLCTFSEHLNPIISESQDYSELKQAIDGIQHYDQETYLTDCLDELLALEAARTDVRYVRVVVISDGVDNNPGGLTRDELETKLEKNNFPIYSVGCTGKAQELKEMYAISRQTGANYWALSESQNYDITHALGNEEIPIRITIPIPSSCCDGTTKGVQVTFEDGTEVQAQVDMPFGAIIEAPPVAEPEPEPEPDPEPIPPPPEPEPEPEPTAADWMREHWLLIVVLALSIAALAVGGYLFFLHRKKTPEENTDKSAPPQRNIIREEDVPPGGILLGRGEDNDVMIDDALVSKRHCAIVVSGDNITVYDLHSLNGTRIDGVKLEKGGSGRARSGSTLTLANVDFELEICTDRDNNGVSSDFGGETIYMNTEDAANRLSASGERVLCITDIHHRDRCYKIPLPDVGNAQPDGTMYMG